MSKSLFLLSVCFTVITPAPQVSAGTYIDINGGIPRGFMLLSGNAAIGKYFDSASHFRPEIRIEGSFSMRGLSGGEHVLLPVMSFYFLETINLKLNSSSGLFIKTGGGIHIITSIATSNDIFGNTLKVESKAHLIPGITYYLSEHSALLSYVRFTAPSHLILDSYYLGMQFKL